MIVVNPNPELRYVDLIVSRVDLPCDAVVGVLLPTPKGVVLKGAQLAKIPLDTNQQRFARELKVSPAAFYRITGAREGQIRVPVPPARHGGWDWCTTLAKSRLAPRCDFRSSPNKGKKW